MSVLLLYERSALPFLSAHGVYQMFRKVCSVASRQSTRLCKIRTRFQLRCVFFSSDTEEVLLPGKSKNNDPNYRYLVGGDGIDPKLQKSIFKAIQSSVSVQRRRHVTVDHMKSCGRSQLGALAAATLDDELKKRDGRGGSQQRQLTTTSSTPATKKRRRITSSVQLKVKIPHHSKEFDLKWKLGESLVDLAMDNEEELGEYIEGACGQTMSCCTCHVYIENEEFWTNLPEADESELDMLDLAYDPKDTSRLGCQIKLSPDLINANISQYEVTIPSGVNNHWT